MFEEYFTPFLKLFVIMDAFGILPIFLMLSDKMPRKERYKAADKTILVATVLLVLFLFGGIAILNYFGISLASFKIAGGIILLLLGLKTVLGLKMVVQEKHAEKYEFTSVPMATPLIVGPGTITTVIILVNEYSHLAVLVIAALNLLIIWAVFRCAGQIYKLIGHQGIMVISRVMGIILTAIAVEMITDGMITLF